MSGASGKTFCNSAPFSPSCEQRVQKQRLFGAIIGQRRWMLDAIPGTDPDHRVVAVAMLLCIGLRQVIGVGKQALAPDGPCHAGVAPAVECQALKIVALFRRRSRLGNLLRRWQDKGAIVGLAEEKTAPGATIR